MEQLGGEIVMIWGGIDWNQNIGPIISQQMGFGSGHGINAQRYID